MSFTPSTNWPATLNYELLAGTPSLQPQQAGLRTDYDEGPASTRLIEANPLYDYSATWVFTDADLKLFRTWYKTELANGTKWFNGYVYDDELHRPAILRFKSVQEPFSGGGSFLKHWQVSAQLEVYDFVADDGASVFFIGEWGATPTADFSLELADALAAYATAVETL